ncbi:unnamed protein product, partial [Rotaria magnacalcarata]
MFTLLSTIARITSNRWRSKQKNVKGIAVSNRNRRSPAANAGRPAETDDCRRGCTRSRWQRANKPTCVISSTS